MSLVNSNANHIELTHDDLNDPPVEGDADRLHVPSNDNTGAVQIRIGSDDYTLQKSNEPNSAATRQCRLGDIEGQHPFEMTYSGSAFWWTGGVVGSASRSNATGGADGHSPVLSSGDAFPTSPSPVENDLHFFFADVASGLDWKDTDGTSDITSADNGDVARFNGTDWVKLGNRRGPAGAEGADGQDGAAGATGATGASGAAGADGADGVATGFTELRAPATLSVADTWTATGATIPAADEDEWVRMNGNFDGEVPENFEFLSSRLRELAEHTVGGTTSTGDVERLQFHDGSVFQRILMARTSANEIILRHESAAQSLGNLSIYSYSSIAGDGAITLTPQTAADKNFNQTTQLGSGQNNRLFDTDITLPTGIGDNELFFIRASSNVGENTIAMTKARLETLVAVTPVTFVSTGTTGVAADRTPGATRNAFSFALGNNRGLLLGISNETPFRLQWGCTHTTVSINLQIVTVAASANAGEGGQQSPGNEGVAEQTPDLVTVVLYQWFDDAVDAIPSDPTAHWRFDDEWDGTTPFQGGGWFTSRIDAGDAADNNPDFDEAEWTLWVATEQTRRKVNSDDEYYYSDSGYSLYSVFDDHYSVNSNGPWHATFEDGDKWMRLRTAVGGFTRPIPLSGVTEVVWQPLVSEAAIYQRGPEIDEAETYDISPAIDISSYDQLRFTMRTVKVANGVEQAAMQVYDFIIHRPPDGWNVFSPGALSLQEGTYQFHYDNTIPNGLVIFRLVLSQITTATGDGREADIDIPDAVRNVGGEGFNKTAGRFKFLGTSEEDVTGIYLFDNPRNNSAWQQIQWWVYGLGVA